MNPNDLFVGGTSVILGVMCIAAAIHNHDWYFRLRKARWVEHRWGRTAARFAYAVLGFCLVGLGVFIMWGRG